MFGTKVVFAFVGVSSADLLGCHQDHYVMYQHDLKTLYSLTCLVDGVEICLALIVHTLQATARACSLKSVVVALVLLDLKLCWLL
jgi:hypothetical protein